MKVFVKDNPIRNSYDIYAYENTANGQVRLYKLNEQGYPELGPQYDPAVQFPFPENLLCTLPYDIVDELVAVHKGLRLSEVTLDALKDARTVRDRLLALVENGLKA